MFLGKLKLDKPRPNEKKSELNDKLKGTREAHVPLPPIQSNGKKANATAYQVVFDANDKMKTKKSIKYPSAVPPGPLPRRRDASEIDQRYLSAERARGQWKSAASKVRPGINATLNESDEEADMLTASLASQRTVASDAFDFLFDSDNLNPEKVLDQVEIERYTEEKLNTEEFNRKGKNVVHQSACCLIA